MMTYKMKIETLCNEQTNLSAQDIDYIVRQAQRLIESEHYDNEDVFIDVQDAYSPEAIVVFHKRPRCSESLYQRDIVGEKAYLRNEPGVLRTLHTGAITIGLSALSQEGKSIQQKVYPLSREEGKVIGAIIVETDVTDELDAHFVSHEKQNVYALTNALSELEQITISKYIQDAILLFDKDGMLKQLNPAAEMYYTDKFGYMDNLLGLHYDNLALDSYTFAQIISRFETHEWIDEQIVEVQYGHYFFEVKRAYDSRLETLIMIFKDITNSKKHEQELVSKSVALREMNHRIKNNLQTVISLLRLQARRSHNESVKRQLNDSINRIFAISTTHELLSKETGDIVDLSKVIASVLENIKRIFAEKDSINVVFEIEKGIVLDSNRAVAVSLVVNELIQNSYDHAFEYLTNENAKICLQIFIKNDLMYIKASDNGKGYSANSEIGKHLGLKLVDEFVKTKLLGKIKVHSDEKGTLTTVSFKM